MVFLPYEDQCDFTFYRVCVMRENAARRNFSSGCCPSGRKPRIRKLPLFGPQAGVCDCVLRLLMQNAGGVQSHGGQVLSAGENTTQPSQISVRSFDVKLEPRLAAHLEIHISSDQRDVRMISFDCAASCSIAMNSIGSTTPYSARKRVRRMFVSGKGSWRIRAFARQSSI